MIVGVGVTCLGLWQLFMELRVWFSQLTPEVATTIIATSGTVLAGVGAVVIGQQRSKAREIAEAHRPAKIEMYEGFINRTMGIVFRSADGAPDVNLADDPEFRSFFRNTMINLVLWGSPAVVSAFSRFRSGAQSSGHDALYRMDDLLRAIRKDLGHSDWRLARGDLVKVFINDTENVK